MSSLGARRPASRAWPWVLASLAGKKLAWRIDTAPVYVYPRISVALQ